MAYQRKTYDEYQLFGNWGYGWDFVLAEFTYKEIRQRLKEYIENDPSAQYRVVKRRVKKDK